MVALILGLLLCVGVAMVVVGLVAVPARREGRDVLTPRGEQVLTRVLEKGPESSAASGGARAPARRRARSGDPPRPPTDPPTGRGGPPAAARRDVVRAGVCLGESATVSQLQEIIAIAVIVAITGVGLVVGLPAPRGTVDQGAAAEGAAARP